MLMQCDNFSEQSSIMWKVCVEQGRGSNVQLSTSFTVQKSHPRIVDVKEKKRHRCGPFKQISVNGQLFDPNSPKCENNTSVAVLDKKKIILTLIIA